MTNTTQNKIHIDKMWGLFIGHFNDNILHQHYALQISISSQGFFEIIDENNTRTAYKTCYINSNIKHQFKSNETSLILLINPISSVGHQLYEKHQNTQIIEAPQKLQKIQSSFLAYLQNHLTFPEMIKKINDTLNAYTCECELENHFADDRIYKAIQFLEHHFDRVVSLDEISKFCSLSETRFLHLFKEKTTLNFRRYQLWNKVIKSLPYLKNNSVTETAHQFGFTDSSHYHRTFKETFGLSPKFLASLS